MWVTICILPLLIVCQVTYHWFAGILSALAAFGIIGGYTTYKYLVKR